ncbi:glycosyltransferase [Microbacterium sp. NPDC077663]|uniref:glycosyltransferase n=1 Tax=Microbacterium sp. NPDC077663 TaxID=3364189 RepID=UPI0037C8B56F
MATSVRTATPPGAESTGAVTIVSIPAGHPYVRRTTSDPRITVLADPVAPGADPAVWWPPAALDPDWIRAHAGDAAILHIHFGTESFPAGHLTACLDAAHAAGWPVVYTLHDLEHPQLGDSSAYLAQLDELMAGADAVTTLTVGAARAARERWGRHATVIPHPSVLPQAAAIELAVGAGRVVGLHLKDLRPSVDGPGAVRTLEVALTALRDAGHDVRGEVRLHRRVRDADAAAEVRALCAASTALDLVEHERLADDDLFAALARLDACVLPYRHGTHSGWLELCWDLGVPVAAPRVGFLAEQHADETVTSFTPGDGAELATVLSGLWVAPSSRPASPARGALVDERRALRAVTDAGIAERHADLYLHLLESRTA